MLPKNEPMIDLLGLVTKVKRAQTVMTVLYRQGSTWTRGEVNNLAFKLMTSVCKHPSHPEYLIIWGDVQSEVNTIIGDGQPFTIKIVTDIDNPQLPFRPNF